VVPFALHKNSIVCFMCFSPAIRDTCVPSSYRLAIIRVEVFLNFGSLRSHMLAFQAPQSKHWSGGRRVCRTCSAAHVNGKHYFAGYFTPPLVFSAHYIISYAHSCGTILEFQCLRSYIQCDIHI